MERMKGLGTLDLLHGKDRTLAARTRLAATHRFFKRFSGRPRAWRRQQLTGFPD
jgi:hypothetical protein